MANRPNILFLMADQMQACVLDSHHICQTPNFEKLKKRGVRFTRAYTPNAVCSPARASIMTGLLPHNHGVCTVTGDVMQDKCVLDKSKKHWAQILQQNDYQTGYFGKWHVEWSERAGDFGWSVDGGYRQEPMESLLHKSRDKMRQLGYSLKKEVKTAGYKASLLYGVTEIPAEERQVGLIVQEAIKFISTAIVDSRPWCCFVSVPEPHDPYVTNKKFFDKYPLEKLNLPLNVFDNLEGRPAIYKKMAGVFKSMTEQELKQARACYFGSISEIDEQFGKILKFLDDNNQTNNTLIVLTTDHGDLLGAHGMFMKGYTAAEEIYNIPLLMAGPGIAKAKTSLARVGSHEIATTILDLVGMETLGGSDSNPFTSALRDPDVFSSKFNTGYAEYHGSRVPMMQRIAWMDDYKYVLNGFDFDELYDLKNDPFELNNLIDSNVHQETATKLLSFIWKRLTETNDVFKNANYPMWRIGKFGPYGNPVINDGPIV